MKIETMLKQMVCIAAMIACLPSILMAELTVGSLFQDHMVLQRDVPVPVWGWCDAGETVVVQFGDQKAKTTSDETGQWRVDLDPLVASFDSRILTVFSTTGERIVLQDVVVGEVWICSGQSNMQFGYGGIPEVSALVPTAKNIRTFNVKRTVAFAEQETCEGEWTESLPESAVAFSFAYFLERAAEMPVGIILTCWGSSGIEAWMPRDMTETVPHFKTMMSEFDANATTQSQIKSILDGPLPWSRQDDIFLRRQPNILYNAMMHPLVPYACRGLVWYQGERNTQSMFGMLKDPWFSRNSGMLKYGDTLQQWVLRSRKEWGNDDMHFLVVMLPSYYKQPKTGPKGDAASPVTHSWAWMRESQLKALELPHTSVVNTIDLGDEKNVHPKDKLPIGERLALLAARDTLGQDVTAEGPVMSKVDVGEGRLIVSFNQVEGLKTLNGATPTGFWVSDESAEWHLADADIVENTVVLQAASCPQPKYVRYAFAGKPSVNLVNGAGLPAYPFRTDQFAPRERD